MFPMREEAAGRTVGPIRARPNARDAAWWPEATSAPRLVWRW
jgi:hypothetical protein